MSSSSDPAVPRAGACPVCGRPAVTRDHCECCGWQLRTSWRLGGGQDAEARFQHRLSVARRRFDLAAVLRANGESEPDRLAVTDAMSHLIRHGPPETDDWEWALHRASASPDEPTPARGKEVLPASGDRVHAGRNTTRIVELDIDGACVRTFDPVGGLRQEGARLDFVPWPAGLGDVADARERAFRLAGGGLAVHDEQLSAFVSAILAVGTEGATDGVSDDPVHLMLRLPSWPVPERVAGIAARLPGVLVHHTAADRWIAPRCWTVPSPVTAAGMRTEGGGVTVVTGDRDGRVRMLHLPHPGSSAPGSDPEAAPVLADTVSVLDVAPDGGLVVAGGWDGAVRAWHPTSGRNEALTAHVGRVHGVHLGAGFVVSFGEDGVLSRCTFDGIGPTGPVGIAMARPMLLGRGAGASSAGGGGLVAVAGQGETVRVVDGLTGQELNAVSAGGRVTALAVAPTGRLLAVGTAQGTTRVHDLQIDEQVGHWPGAGGESAHDRAVTVLAVSGTGAVIAGYGDGRCTWRRSPTSSETPLGRHIGTLRAAALADGPTAVTASRDGVIRRWPLPIAARDTGEGYGLEDGGQE